MTYNSSFRVNKAGQSVNRNNVCRLVVPRAVFPPVRGGNLLPGVIKVADVLEDPHRRVLCVLVAEVDCVNARIPGKHSGFLCFF